MPKMIEHTIKVLQYAKNIASSENIDSAFTKNVITIGSILHDIGTPSAIKKYGSAEPEYQQREGYEIAKNILSNEGIRDDIKERILYIILHHHEPEKIDGIDFRIIYEADTIVNVLEENIKLEKSKNNYDQFIIANFRTSRGKKNYTKNIIQLNVSFFQKAYIFS